jgi:hypothetical protein
MWSRGDAKKQICMAVAMHGGASFFVHSVEKAVVLLPRRRRWLVFCFSDFVCGQLLLFFSFLFDMSYCFSDSVNSVAQFGVGMRLALSVVLYHAHASSIDLIDRSCS